MPTQIDPRLERDIGTAEGSRLTAYKDTNGFWTIGRGHLLVPTDHDWSGYTITPEEEETYFQADILNARDFAQRLPEWKSLDTTCRQNALVELCFNLGSHWLGFFTARALIRAQKWVQAAADLLATLWARQVGPTRSERIAGYLRTGQYPQ